MIHRNFANVDFGTASPKGHDGPGGLCDVGKPGLALKRSRSSRGFAVPSIRRS